ncbi:MAG: Trk family potassium uptake protein, partial [Clostridia bacterium]|nr:Trk family potassium uptake protein [Clostridia bacterium]
MLKNFFRKLSPSAIFIAGFFIIIFLGGAVLSLPVSSASGEPTPFLDSLFTAVSSTCITGLVVYDTATHWSTFGHAVLLFLIQIGGLGFMSVATVFSLVFRRSVGHKERMMLAQNFNLDDMSDISKLFKHIIVGTFAFEGAAAIILAFRFIPDFGLTGGIWRGIF